MDLGCETLDYTYAHVCSSSTDGRLKNVNCPELINTISSCLWGNLCKACSKLLSLQTDMFPGRMSMQHWSMWVKFCGLKVALSGITCWTVVYLLQPTEMHAVYSGDSCLLTSIQSLNPNLSTQLIAGHLKWPDSLIPFAYILTRREGIHWWKSTWCKLLWIATIAS